MDDSSRCISWIQLGVSLSRARLKAVWTFLPLRHNGHGSGLITKRLWGQITKNYYFWSFYCLIKSSWIRLTQWIQNKKSSNITNLDNCIMLCFMNSANCYIFNYPFQQFKRPEHLNLWSILDKCYLFDLGLFNTILYGQHFRRLHVNIRPLIYINVLFLQNIKKSIHKCNSFYVFKFSPWIIVSFTLHSISSH